MNEIISIIVPIYNIKKELLEKCIQSLINQTYKNIEIILVDDGSEQWCVDCYIALKNLDSRIKVLRQSNTGVSTARNNGIIKAIGDWIMFVDGDDWIENNCCEKFCNIIKDNKDIDIIIGKNYLEYENYRNEINNYYSSDNKLDSLELKKELLISIFNDNIAKYRYVDTPWAKLYKRTFLIEKEIFFKPDLKLGEDGLFNYEAYSLANSIYYMNENIYHYRINSNSVCNKFNNFIVDNYTYVFEYYTKLFKKEKIMVLNDEYMYFGFRQIYKFIKKYYCNKNNPRKISESKREFFSLLSKEPYKTFFNNVDIEKINLKQRIIWKLIKVKQFWLIYLLVNVR